MEYPPRKFHPLRKQPQVPPDVGRTVDYLTGKRNKMIRTLRGLGVRLFDRQKYEADLAQYNALAGDLIEDIPKPAWKQDRRQNMIHRDIDPSNSLCPPLKVYLQELTPL